MTGRSISSVRKPPEKSRPGSRAWTAVCRRRRLIVLTPRGDRAKAEALTLTVMILDHGQPQAAVLRWRTLGAGPWHEVPLRHIARAVHTVTLPTAGDDRPPLFNPNLRTQSVLLFLRQLVRPDNQRFQLREHVQIPH